MKTLSMFAVVLAVAVSAFSSTGQAQCNSNSILKGGVDILPWSVVRPFPWDNVQGYWQLGDNTSIFLKAKVLSSTSRRKILQLTVHVNGLCSKATARGTGYVDASEKNVVRALISDANNKYQVKLGLFDSRDLALASEGAVYSCFGQPVMAASMQLLESNSSEGVQLDLETGHAETQNLLLKKVTVDVAEFCKNRK